MTEFVGSLLKFRLPVPGVPNEIGMSCLANPFVGREQELQIKPVEKAKNIMVIGAGPS